VVIGAAGNGPRALGAGADEHLPRGRTVPGPAAEVLWHELECGCYRADLALWRELADREGGPILDIGAGAGRVSTVLADAGHEVVAVDVDETLLGALTRRATAVEVQTACTDARALALGRRDFGLCIVPMQTIQLLGGRPGRLAFVRAARAHLRRGGALACAIASALEPFDCTRGDPAPVPDSMRVGGVLYVSRPTRVQLRRDGVLIERERLLVALAGDGCAADGRSGSADGAPAGADGRSAGPVQAVERSVIELDRLSPAQLQREAAEVGLRPEPTRQIPASEEHTGSAVVMLRA
jgi:SAM-dependent methyltransferase